MNVLSYIQHASSVFIPVLANFGFATSILESVAKAVGAGMLMSGFVMAVAGLLLGWSRRDVEARGLRDACIGGLIGCGLLILDFSMRYFV